MGLLLFLIYINDLPNITIDTNLSDTPKTVLFVDDTSIIVNNPNFTDFEKVVHMVFENMNKWLSFNLLSLNFGNTHFMQFITKHSSHNVRNINCNKIILNTSTLEILGIIINNTLSCKSHIDMITPKSQACYIVKVVKPFLSQDTLKIMYYAYFHSVMTYRIIYWEIPHTMVMFLDYKKELLELQWEPEQETHVKNFLKV
jgi:hypothetical protein